MHRLIAQPSGGEETLVPTNHGLVVAPCECRLNKAELLQAAGQGFKLLVGDPARVCGVGPQIVDLHFVDGHRLCGLRSHCASSFGSWGMRRLRYSRTALEFCQSLSSSDFSGKT